jgi:hypothetical protein
MVGLPGESDTTAKETELLLAEAELDDCDIKVFQPYPGSPIWDHKRDYDIDWDEQVLSNMYYKGHKGEYCGSVRTSHLSNAQIVDWQLKLEQKYKRW